MSPYARRPSTSRGIARSRRPKPRSTPGSGFEREAERALADGDHVAVRQLLLDHGLAVDQSPVGAAEVADPERAGSDLDPPVMPGRRRVAHDDVVVGGAADGDHLARQGDDPARKRAGLEG